MLQEILMIKSVWCRLKAIRPRYGVGLLVAAAGIGGILLWGGLHAVLDLTNTETFCISCHQMRDTVYKEYSTTVHYKNPSGVRASCPDCHVPKQWGPKLMRKAAATTELYHALMGTIDTPEKFEANRLAMARRVWDDMAATNSRECRNCHTDDAMDFHKMKKPEEAERMKKGLLAGQTCVSCHKGIAHKMPDLSQGYQSMLKEINAAAASRKVGKGDVVYSFRTGSLFIDVANVVAGATGEGKLLAASQAKVVDQKGDWALVKMEGWQQQGAERVIYALKGQRIINAVLGETLVEKTRREAPVEDPDTGLVWSKVALEAWVAKADLTADQSALWAYGSEMYRSTCGTCHNLPPTDHLLANQVTGTLNAMKRFVSLDDEEYRFLQKYLQFNAKDTGGKQHE
jgi:trimethylamine-N-oxide reductase (cytochrome c), cytochrome c-type subunit TorC